MENPHEIEEKPSDQIGDPMQDIPDAISHEEHPENSEKQGTSAEEVVREEIVDGEHGEQLEADIQEVDGEEIIFTVSFY